MTTDAIKTQALDSVANGVLITDGAGAILWANRAFARLSGHSIVQLEGLAITRLAFVDDQVTLGRLWHQLRETGAFAGTVEFQRPDGDVVRIELRGRAGIEDHHVLIVAVDITARQDLDVLAARMAQVLDAVDRTVVTTDLDGTIESWNRAAEQLLGWRASEVVGRNVADVAVPPWARGAVDRARSEVITSGTWSGTADLARRDGTLIPVQATASLLRDADGSVTGMVGVAIDVSEQLQHTRELALNNGWLNSIARHVGTGLVTLDHRGRIVYSNPAADQLLMTTAHPAVGGSFTNRLLGVDPFGNAGTMQQRLIGDEFSTLAEDEFIEDRLVRGDGSVVPIEYIAARLPRDDSDDRGWVVTFRDITDRLEREAAWREQVATSQWIVKINEALDNDRFVLFAQPIVDIASTRVVQHELLIRMLDDDGTLIQPREFIPTAETHGLMPAIDRWVIQQAIGLAREGHAVELNLSATSLNDDTLIHVIEGLLTDSGIDPGLLVFELTETGLAENFDTAAAFLGRLHTYGCHLAIDDFGVGYGGLTYLKSLPIDIIKIDIEFVRDLLDNATSRNVVSAVVALAQVLNMKTVAEGVEDKATLDALQSLGVDLAQGYHLGKPRPVVDVIGQGKDKR